MATDERSCPTEDAAFESFYRAHWHDAARWGTALCGSVHRGEEAAQEAFLRLASRFSRLDHPTAYLRRTLVNISHDMHRSTIRRAHREARTVRLTVVPDPDVGDGPDPELFEALNALPQRQRIVLTLRYWADWDDAMIAEAIDCRPATVRSSAKRGLDRLRIRLEKTS